MWEKCGKKIEDIGKNEDVGILGRKWKVTVQTRSEDNAV